MGFTEESDIVKYDNMIIQVLSSKIFEWGMSGNVTQKPKKESVVGKTKEVEGVVSASLFLWHCVYCK